MSLLGNGARYEPCTVYPEVEDTSPDGNPFTKPSTTGVPAMARFQVSSQSGTSSRRAEQDNEGFESEQVYAMRFHPDSAKDLDPLGAQSEVEWLGKRWTIFGDPRRFNGSSITARYEYALKRY